MKSNHLLNEVILSMVTTRGSIPSDGAKYYLRKGIPIPDYLLPGRAIQYYQHKYPKAFQDLKSDDIANIAPWWIKIMCD